MRLYLDCDGVLADFDRAAAALLGMSPRQFEERYGPAQFWKRIERQGDFYAALPLMPDAIVLFEAVRHLDPIILTGLPQGAWATPQKVRWAAEHFPGTRIITCLAAHKSRHARDGDILVDDTLKYHDLWTGAGGTFVHHRDAATTLCKLRRLCPEAMAAAPIRQEPTGSG